MSEISVRSTSDQPLFSEPDRTQGTRAAPKNFFARIFSRELSLDFSSLKEKWSGLNIRSWSFPSIQDGIRGLVDWSGSNIRVAQADLPLEQSAQEPIIPSAATFKKSVGNFFRRMYVFGRDSVTYANYKILLKTLDQYQYLPQQTEKEMDEALAKLDSLEKHVGRMTSSKEVLAPLSGAINLEKIALSLKKELVAQITGYTKEQEKSFQENVNGGAVGTVSLVTYQNGKEGFFKAVSIDAPMTSEVGVGMGIPETSTLAAKLAARAVLSYEVAKLLKSDLVPETVFASHGEEVGSFQVTAKGVSLSEEKKQSIPYSSPTATLLAFYQEGDLSRQDAELSLKSFQVKIAPDNPTLTIEEDRVYESGVLLGGDAVKSLYKEAKIQVHANVLVDVNNIDFSHPSLQQAMANAHIFDLLTGQVDRNTGNLFYEKLEDGSYQLHLIDNDQSFPASYEDFSENKPLSFERGCSLRELPRLIDEEMANKITNLKGGDLSVLMAQRGMTQEEITATCHRLSNLQSHIKNVQSGNIEGGRLVSTWDDAAYKQLCERRDNYTFRSLDDVKRLKESLNLKTDAAIESQ